MSQKITTLYLIPHAHTDLGYTHDPVVSWELHDHFLDRAIDLCEATADAVEHERFHWTIEVYCSLEHWWERRGSRDRERLLALMRSGQIDLGRRYTNGTFLNTPINIEWEVERAASFCSAHGLSCRTVFQNDVNGMSIRYARELASYGTTGFVMGINNTMGVSPFPRPGAFWWKLDEEHRFLVWNGWIYNRIKRYVHLNELSTKLEAAWPELIARLPEDYPFSFAMMSGTIGDNVGPFVHLPGQVEKFNARHEFLQVRLTTITRFLEQVAKTSGLAEYAGDWNDAWTFGSASMPQEVALLRRSQRMLEVIDLTRQCTPVADLGVQMLIDQAQHEVSIACEHTYCSHTSEFEHTLGDDGRRQWVQSQICFLKAHSFSTLALRKTLVDIASRFPVDQPSALLVNPTARELPIRLLLNRKAATHIATSEVLEHLTQLDREPTLDWVVSAPEIGIPQLTLPPRSVQVVPLQEIENYSVSEVQESGPVCLSHGGLAIEVDANGSLTQAVPSGRGRNWMGHASEWASGIPVLEHPAPETSLKFESESEKRDPSDAEWNPALRFDRRPVGRVRSLTRRSSPYWEEVVVAFEESPVRKAAYRIDSLLPDLLQIELQIRLDDSSDTKALYFPLAFHLEGNSDINFYYDSCGQWIRAVDGQLPGSGTSFYESYRGVALERDGKCIYLAAPDSPLWQFGGLTYGHPHARINRSQATVVSWLYNNYWYTNFPSLTPALYQLRYLVAFKEDPFDPEVAQKLYDQFCSPFLWHPIWPKQHPAD